MYVPNFDQTPPQKVGQPADASQRMQSVAEQVYQKCKIMILVVDGVSLTTVASIMDPFMHANKILGRDRFDLERVSLLEHDPLTTAGVRLACE
ncbi:MAG: hypothetical protein ACPHVO_09490, partial [Paracoccaceae bacterium]